MRVLLIVAHPLDDSFAKAATARVRSTLERRGMEVDLIDLYADGFDPRLTGDERRGYFASPYDFGAVEGYVDRLKAADKLALVFPQWWFNMPAILKGFFDRVFVPGVAFDHGPGGGLIAGLTNIDALYVVSSTGAPWWYVRLYMGDPARRQIGRGMRGVLNPKSRFRMLTLHDMDKMTTERACAFLDRVERAFLKF
ncbi:NAD(P)H-dependent oxidoreductase [Methylocapsa palsarum]|uniref:Putative NADPH-quinone reductase (Modulator of drug activity B) n=1 Tax=Methylocapsa palsarum TaxID=1612308 RepID=A0A1I4BS28_9HYPH|nr:NAD(P)H-dependent oxidoreductase [Methylocapsa palsarum]SFK71632.1 Putative NADPH-quinone reductase (modulator of drug activity B) [Methylocapsa palsarum]